ncbi:transposable element Tcb1 transposase [Trichonephila clavipes]|nr:transposable element Tcb1 transposase [Trichonephila clavipes]
MFRRKQESAFNQVSEFDRGKIVAYRDCGLSFRKIDSRVGRNQTTVMRICDRWMQEGTADRRGQSRPPQCTTLLSACTIRRRLQLSGLPARRPLLGLPLTQNHRRLRRQWCDERRMWVTELKDIVFTDESRTCLKHHNGWIRVWKHRGERMLNRCVMHHHTDPAPSIMGFATAIFQQDNARPHVERFPGRLTLWKTCGPWLLNDCPRLHPQLPHQINFGNVWKLLGLLYPKNTSKVCLNQCLGMWQR